MKKLLLVLVALTMAACTTTNTRVAPTVAKPSASARILVVRPDVRLSLLTAAGLPEARADWSSQGQANLENALVRQMEGKGYVIKRVDPKDAMGGREGQLLRLHEAVGGSILTFNYGVYTLPTKAGTFDWTLGEGATTLSETYGADYALFTYGGGSYASSGRVIAMIGLAALGVGIPMGQQQVFTSLVDLRTGKVVWFNYSVASPNADMRQQAGADNLVGVLMKAAPL